MQLLDSLAPAQREVMALAIDEFTPAEIARLLGKTAVAARQNLHVARTRLTLTLLDQDQATQPSSHPKSKQATEGGP
jgi:DNA-directed RNA polymerase specialized sigma24 family protein